ncbi:MAG: M16 family metallopeptidase [Steroidobacterales bacterium]
MIRSMPMMKVVVALALLGVALAANADMAQHAERSRTAGIDLVAYHTEVRDVVDVVGYLPAGDAMAGTGNAALPTLMGMMLDRGTRTQDRFSIARQLEEVGAEISFNVGVQALQFQGRCLKKDLPLVLSLLASELRSPAFLPAEFAKARQQYIGMLENSRHSTEARARESLQRALFPPGHPNRRATIEELLTAAKSASLKDLQAFHAKYYGPEHMTMVLVGDVTLSSAADEVGKDFAGWSGGQDFLRPAVAAGVEAPKGDILVPLAEKTSVSVLLGQRTLLRYRDPDALALRVGTAIAGHGFTGRLMSNVRDRLGLTYDIGAGVADDSLADGMWFMDASFAPKLLEQGIAASRGTLQAWWQDGVTEKELADTKQGLAGGYYVGLATNRGLATAIVNALQRGYDLAWLDAYPRALQALTRDQVNAAIHHHLNPATMVLVEAGSLPVR